MPANHHQDVLLCPGPVNVHPEVASAMTAVDMCHREDDFSALLDDVSRKILEVAGASSAYGALVISGSGTAANEAVLSSAVERDTPVLVLANGEFGERLAAISELHHPETTCLKHRWGTPIDLRRVASWLDTHPAGLVAMVHHETSTGMLNPVLAVGAMCRARGIPFFVDAVSSFSADPLDLDAAGVTYMTSSGGKAISSYPGVAVVIGQRSALAECAEREGPVQYLDLGRHWRFFESRRQTPNTPALPLILALDRALGLALEEGMPQRYARMAGLASLVRRRARALGLELLLVRGARSSVVTSIVLPSDVRYEALRVALRARGYVFYGGKGPLADRIFQVSTLGTVGRDEVHGFFDVLEEVLADLRGQAPMLRAVAS